jgi:hypothetical protein
VESKRVKDQSNVIQFPKPQPQPSASQPAPSKPVAKKRKWNSSLLLTGGSLFAIALATGVTNVAFLKNVKSEDDRMIASAAPEERNAAWEKSVAESLASADVREVASLSVGREASIDESLRYGALERKYTILRDLKRNEVESIILQGSGAEPSMVADRSEFLGKYGHWMSPKYSFAELKSSETIKDRRYESFAIYDTDHKAYAIARFELDNYQRLLAFHWKPL